MKFIALCILLFITGVAQSQIDFNNYEKVKSKGEIPESFKLTLEERFSQDFETNYGLSKRDQYEYVFSKSASIDNLIQSGLVVYGDEMTAYIQDLAKELLANDQELYNRLSFFTLRSNVSNAFVTGDGMVFVTMGLLSQLASESDLAFVLSHEIAHFEEKHVLNGFKIRKELEKQDLEDEIENFSDYSKKHELEADSIGLIRYLKAGYEIAGVEQVFDILMYSHLPIDEVNITPEYLVGDLAYFPEEFLLKEEKEISFTEDYDDKNSTHPNIKSRKKYALKLYEENLSEYKGKDQSLLGENRFENIRSIARFERVQNWLYARSYANCLYEIAVLEKSYPNNKFLKRWKAIAWTNAAVYATMGNNSDIFTSARKLEGKIAGIHHVFDKFSDEDFIVFAMRNVLDLKSDFPDDRMFAKMEETLLQLMIVEDMDFAEFKDKSLNEAVEELQQHLDSISELESSLDTIQVDKNKYGYTVEEWDALSKYEKLKVKKGFKTGDQIKNAAQIDTSEYLLYALSDIAKNEDYINRFESYIDEIGRKDDLKDSISNLKPRQLARYNEELNSLVLKDENLIFVEPLAIRMNYGKVKYMKTLKLSERMHKAYDEYPEKFDKKESIVNLNKHNLANVGTKGYNARASLERYFYRYMDIKSNYYINPDMQEFEDISKEYDSDYFMFSLLVDDKRLTLNRYYLVMSFYTFFTALPPHVIIELTKMHKVEYAVLVFDLENGYVVKQRNKGYFGKKNFFTLGFNPTIDINIPFFSVQDPFLSGNEIKTTPLLKPRLGGITLGYSRAFGNRFMIGANLRKSQFFIAVDDNIWSSKFSNGIYYFEGIKMSRTQASVFIEFASYKWKSLLMGNFMNRLEFGFDIFSIPDNDDFKYIDNFFVSEENTFDKEDLQTIDLREYKLPSEAKNRGAFLRYSAIQSTPLTQSFILRYGFDVTFYITYMEFFRGNNLGEDKSPEARVGRAIARRYQFSSFRNPVTFRLELVYAL